MTPEEVVELFRLDVDDVDANDPLWSTLEVYHYLDAAQKEFARKTDYFSDSSTTAITQVTVTAAAPFVNLDYRITKIRSGLLTSTGNKIWPTTFAEMEDQPNTVDAYDSPFNYNNAYNWRIVTGTPRFMVMDVERGKGRLAPIPVINDTIELRVYRLPLEDIVEDCPDFEITETEYQRSLITYMKFLAYGRNDVDTQELELAAKFKIESKDTFDDIKRDLTRMRYSSHTSRVRYGGL